MRISDWSSDVCSSDLMDEAIALIEKMFDTSDLPPIDPARLTLAERTTAALIPNGSIEKMVDNLYGKMFKTFMGEFGGQSDLLLSIKTGGETEQIAAPDDATKGQIADLFDKIGKAPGRERVGQDVWKA